MYQMEDCLLLLFKCKKSTRLNIECLSEGSILSNISASLPRNLPKCTEGTIGDLLPCMDTRDSTKAMNHQEDIYSALRFKIKVRGGFQHGAMVCME